MLVDFSFSASIVTPLNYLDIRGFPGQISPVYLLFDHVN